MPALKAAATPLTGEYESRRKTRNLSEVVRGQILSCESTVCDERPVIICAAESVRLLIRVWLAGSVGARVRSTQGFACAQPITDDINTEAANERLANDT